METTQVKTREEYIALAEQCLNEIPSYYDSGDPTVYEQQKCNSISIAMTYAVLAQSAPSEQAPTPAGRELAAMWAKANTQRDEALNKLAALVREVGFFLDCRPSDLHQAYEAAQKFLTTM